MAAKKKILIMAISALTICLPMLVSCNNGGAVRTAKHPPVYDTIQVIRGYKAVGDTDLTVEKLIIEGHEYWAIFGRLAGAPSVVHSETCPCKQDNNDLNED